MLTAMQGHLQTPTRTGTVSVNRCIYRVAQKLAHILYALTSYALTSSNTDRFLNLFHCMNQGHS